MLISSATASGKTEAAFLPICTAVEQDAPSALVALYISPLKALINDQQQRLESLWEAIDAPVTPWHGDVGMSRKQKLLKQPAGMLLITPESLEALFVRRGPQLPGLFHCLRYIVVDELHAFIGTERGRQLQSQLRRIEVLTGRSIPRIGLSATLGDRAMASEFLRPGGGKHVEQVHSDGNRRDVLLQVRGYRLKSSGPHTDDMGDDRDIARHLYTTLRGGTHLLFANRRDTVERYADLLRGFSADDGVPNEFHPHHGSLSKELREDAEELLRSERPATVIATTTLELGIDVGAVDSIAQVGVPPSVASLRQRLGRSGRRPGEPSTVRIYIKERELGPDTPPQDQLRAGLVQAVAMVRLLIRGWIEPPEPAALHLSTLVQQVLSLAAQYGGFKAQMAYRVLAGEGPFSAVTPEIFANSCATWLSTTSSCRRRTAPSILAAPANAWWRTSTSMLPLARRKSGVCWMKAASLDPYPLSNRWQGIPC